MEQKLPQISVVLPQEYQEQLFQQLILVGTEAFKKVVENQDRKLKLVNQTELLKILGIGNETLEELINNGLTIHKLGRKNLFNLEEVENIIIEKFRI